MKTTKMVCLFIIIIALSACKKDAKGKNDNYTTINKSAASSECLAPANWFTMVNNTRQTPPPNEGPTSVFANNATVTNCDFHKWSWQKFLWLTNEVNGKPLFMTNLIQVNAAGQKLDPSNGIVLTDTAQASSNTDILQTPKYQSGVPKQTTVYYSIFMDQLLYDTMIKYGPIAKNDPTKVKDITFPVGALELKTSWIDASALKDTSTYFVTQGVINGVKTKVALLGMHVVGIVENHPEFVWATFEHENLAPAYDWTKATPTADAPVTSTVDYPFFNKNNTATVQNITTGNGNYTDVFSVYKYGVPVEKAMKGSFNVQLYMDTSQNGSENFNNIRTINQSVKTQLTGIWNNYFYNGSLWINTAGYNSTPAQAALLDSLSYNLSNSSPGDLTRGSTAAYNITMETYVQVGFSPSSIHGNTVNNLVNCFSCHNASNNSAESPLFISHVFTGYVQNLQGLNRKQIKDAHVKEIVKQFNMRLKLKQAKSK
ncbi:hypothetical protein PQ462_06545 [Flavobacterium sp. KACC 22758]|uniref:hypothetical protein n=1 Tax=Flavobacterium sp. KACC 22758 TaxID=3025667 RepID=UPI0023657DD8|nr:hypothetical protein [Flavobacterium sp. KACC 22758]WDF61019.1 hypothetical protein PQ462_06545 [Flavobacterium sp. KACC 22758]